MNITGTHTVSWWIRDCDKEHQGNISKKVNLLGRTAVFGIASLTKLFVAAAFYELLESYPSKVSATDLVSKHLKIDLSPYQTTLWDLLNHHNALPYANDILLGPGNVILADKDPDAFLQVAQKAFELAKCNFQRSSDGNFNDRWDYSNLNYICLGIIIEHISQMTLEKYITERIINPLKLKHTSFDEKNINTVDAYVGYKDGSRRKVRPVNHSGEMTCAAMGMYSSARDLGLFLNYLCERSRLSKHYIDFFFPVEGRLCPTGSIHCLGSIQGSDWSPNKDRCPSSYYQLGQSTDALNRQALHLFQGHVTGYDAAIAVAPRADFISVALTNTSGRVDASAFITKATVQHSFDLRHGDMEVDVVEMTRRAGSESRWWYDHHFPFQPILHPKGINELVGTYQASSGYELEIFRFTNTYKLRILNGASSSPPLSFSIMGDTITIVPDGDAIDLGIDVLGSWKSLRLEILRDGDPLRLRRQDCSYNTDFTRRSDYPPEVTSLAEANSLKSYLRRLSDRGNRKPRYPPLSIGPGSILATGSITRKAQKERSHPPWTLSSTCCTGMLA